MYPASLRYPKDVFTQVAELSFTKLWFTKINNKKATVRMIKYNVDVRYAIKKNTHNISV